MIYSMFQKRPYLSRLLLGVVFVLGVAWIVQAGTDIFPSRYRVRNDWLLGCLLFATTLTWVGAAALAGATAPVGRTMMRFTYGALLAFFLVFFGLLPAGMILDQYFDTELDWLYPFDSPIAGTLWAWMALVGLAGSLAPRDIDAKAYIPLVSVPIFSGIFVLTFLIGRDVPSNWGVESEPIASALLGSYGLAVSLLFKAFLIRLTWIDRFWSNLLFIPVGVFTAVLTILTLGLLESGGFPTLAPFVTVILLPFGVVTLWGMWNEQCRERGLRHVRAAVAALGIAMASYWAVFGGSYVVGGFLFPSSRLGWAFLMPVIAGMFIAVPAGYLISEMRHPHRNVLVAAIGPGLLMFLIMSYYWLGVLDKGL